ncbi:GDSL-type esterase/lipase family protein [Paenibacillus sp. YN15]|uniref:SGNH/GDSL hydrolase family protein n=1 Tax=Paenibacillus sp. YN15 TaxID=1742774 RepID=UPI000DCC308E|nr:GDSL-type esterase/lipase family protein [Paenibacillus sp. YN15]RAU98103.1 hypothetical protein DQG13_17575 [Paenibacillus sp. YN15]
MIIEKNARIVFFGDSLTRRSGIKDAARLAQRYALDYCESYVDVLLKKMLVRYPGLEVEAYNKGAGGNTAVDLLNRVHRDILKLTPDWVVLFIGQNDAQQGFTVAEYTANLTKLLDLFQEQGIQVLQLSTTPCPNPQRENVNMLLDAYDAVIQELSSRYGNLYVDVKRQFKHIREYNQSAASPVNLFNQGCHFSELGNMLLAELVLDAMISGKELLK